MTGTKHTLNELLVGLFNYILFLEERNLKKQGIPLSMTEVHLLESIAKASDNTMSHIARRSMITQGTLTTSIKKLEQKGYVKRIKDESDRRVIRLNLSEPAYDILKIHDRFHEEMIDRAIADLGLEENQNLIDSLNRIMDYFREQYPEDETYQ